MRRCGDAAIRARAGPRHTVPMGRQEGMSRQPSSSARVHLRHAALAIADRSMYTPAESRSSSPLRPPEGTEMADSPRPDDDTAPAASDRGQLPTAAVFAGILDSLPVGIYVLDRSGRPCYANQAAQRLLGRGVDPSLEADDLASHYQVYMAGTGILYPTEQLPIVRALAGESSFADDIEVETDVGRVPLQVTGSPWLNEAGEIEYAVATFSDLSQMAVAADTLHDQEARSVAVLEAAKDGIITIDERGQIQSVNRAVTAIFGWDAHDMIGRNVSMLMPEPDHSRHDGYLAAYRDTGKKKVIGEGRDVVGKRRDGSPFPVELTVTEVHLKRERLFTGFIRDVTAVREAQAARGRLAAIIEASPDLVAIAEPHGDLIYVNQGGRVILGLGTDAAIGANTLADFYPPSTEETLSSVALPQAIATGSWQGEAEVLDREGDCQPVLMTVIAHRDPAGELEFVSTVCRDIRHRKEVERLKSEFVSTVSHELRTPLTAIRGSLGLVEGGIGGELPPRALQLVTVARSNTERLVRLINDILDLEKIEAGRMELHRAENEPAALARTALDGIAGMAGDAQVALVLDDSTSETVRVMVDPDRILQVLTNLLSNAIKFSSAEGTVHLEVGVPSPGTVRWSVRDTGPGIPAAELGLIFERFRQADGSDTRKRGGTGLGLAICKAIADQHGGRIGVASVLGEGSTFFVEVAGTGTLVSADNAAVGSRAGTVLVVEDDEAVAATLLAMLTDAGYGVRHVRGVADALVALRERPSDALLLDLTLIDGSGFDLLAAIQEASDLPDHMPVVILSGRGPEGRELVGPMVVDWLSKPSDPAEIVVAVRRALRGAKRPTVLLVEDDASTRMVLATQLSALGVDVVEAEDGRAALRRVASAQPDLIVLDVGLPGMDGFDLVSVLRRGPARYTPLLVYTGRDLQDADRARLTLGLTKHLTKGRESDGAVVDAIRTLMAGFLELPPKSDQD